jgi:hypothetical protein
MGDSHDLDYVLGTHLVNDRIRKGGHHVIVHGSIRRETLHEGPALRRLGHGVEGRADCVEKAIGDGGISFIVPAGTVPNVGARLPGDDEVQLAAPTETAFNLAARFRPRHEIGAPLLDVAGPLFEFLDPLGIEAAVHAARDALEQLVRDVRTLRRVELERGFDDLFCGGRHDYQRTADPRGGPRQIDVHSTPDGSAEARPTTVGIVGD